MPDQSNLPDTPFVGSPDEIIRATGARFVDSARADFAAYISTTLASSMGAGGRFNPIGEFGAVYCADSESTMWAEVSARLQREGVHHLPDEMGILRILLQAGSYADLVTPEVCTRWGVDYDSLVFDDGLGAHRLKRHQLARDIRVVADFIAAPSARDVDGMNYAVYPDRRNSSLQWKLISATVERPPENMRQQAREQW